MVDPPKTDAEKAEKKEKSFADSEQQPVGEPKKIGEAQYTFYLCDTLNYLNKHKEQKITHTLHVGDEVQLSSSSKESQGVGWFVVSIFRRYNTRTFFATQLAPPQLELRNFATQLATQQLTYNSTRTYNSKLR